MATCYTSQLKLSQLGGLPPGGEGGGGGGSYMTHPRTEQTTSWPRVTQRAPCKKFGMLVTRDVTNNKRIDLTFL